MATIRFTEGDRDSRGFIRLSPPAAEVASDAPALPPAPAPPIVRTPAPSPMSPRLRYQLTIAAAVVAGLLLVLLSVRFSPTPGAIQPGTLLPTAAATSATLHVAPFVAPTRESVAMLDAYGAPNEAPRWQIESTRVITPLAHYGSDWIQADVAGSGLVWLRASDVPELAIVGPDLAPRPTAIPQAATAPPPPPPCAEAGIPGKMVRVCDYDDLSVLQEQAKAQWIDQYGGNAGVVTTPTPPDWSKP